MIWLSFSYLILDLSIYKPKLGLSFYCLFNDDFKAICEKFLSLLSNYGIWRDNFNDYNILYVGKT